MLAQGAVVLALLVLAQAGASSSNSTALPNVDGLWAGHGSIGIGLGTTFSFASEVGAAGVEALIGGYLLVRSCWLAGRFEVAVPNRQTPRVCLNNTYSSNRAAMLSSE
jgi:hypothetical protein